MKKKDSSSKQVHNESDKQNKVNHLWKEIEPLLKHSDNFSSNYDSILKKLKNLDNFCYLNVIREIGKNLNLFNTGSQNEFRKSVHFTNFKIDKSKRENENKKNNDFLSKLCLDKYNTGVKIKPLYRNKEIAKMTGDNWKLRNQMNSFYRSKRQKKIEVINSNENLNKENKRLEKENSRLLEGKYKKYFNVWRLETEGVKGKKQYYYNFFIKTRPALKNYPYKKFSDNNRQDLSKINKKNMQV